MNTMHATGVVGFAAMAKRMAARLRDSGRSVIAFDPAYNDQQVDGFVTRGSAAAVGGGRRGDCIRSG